MLHFFSRLRGRLEDQLRDLTFTRQRLRFVQEILHCPDIVAQRLCPGADRQIASETTGYGDGTPCSGVDLSPGPNALVSTESFWESIRESTTARVVLPNGLGDLEMAADVFLETLTAENWVQLDQALQDHVLAGYGGLLKACLSSMDLQRHLVPALLSQASTQLGTLLPVTDVAEMELNQTVSAEGEVRCADNALYARIKAYYEQATPLCRPGDKETRRPGDRETGPSVSRSPVSDARQAGPVSLSAKSPGLLPMDRTQVVPHPSADEPDNQHSFLLIPGSPAGKSYSVEAMRVLEGLHIVNVPGQADLMFCRELDYLRMEDLERILQSCRSAYEEAATLPASSPHARFDIQDSGATQSVVAFRVTSDE